MAEERRVEREGSAANRTGTHRFRRKPFVAPVDLRRWLRAFFARPGLRSKQQGKRVAFVLGNSQYPGEAALKSPRQDATAIAKQLRALGFTVKLKTDLTRGELQQAIENFLEKEVPGADVALLYYSGHGVQIDGENYLVPVQEEIRDRSDLVHVDSIVHRIGNEAKLTIVILDACRSNPSASQSPELAKGVKLAKIKGTSPGLAWMEADQDMYVAYAAAPGRIAYAGTAKLSPFTESPTIPPHSRSGT